MNIDNKFLLVCLQLIIVLVMSMIVEGMLNEDAPIEPSGYPFQQFLYSSPSGSHERATRLYQECSNKIVVILNDRVSTTNNRSTNYGDLVLETILKGGLLRIRIRGLESKKYVCYKKRGKMIPKSMDKATGLRCEFREEQVGGHFQYRSLYNNTWVLGFNRNGRPLLRKTVRHDDCFKFLKARIPNPEAYPEKLHRHFANISEHNRRIGHTSSDPRIASTNSKVVHSSRHVRHGKKSHPHRGTHSHRFSFDR